MLQPFIFMQIGVILLINTEKCLFLQIIRRAIMHVRKLAAAFLCLIIILCGCTQPNTPVTQPDEQDMPPDTTVQQSAQMSEEPQNTAPRTETSAPPLPTPDTEGADDSENSGAVSAPLTHSTSSIEGYVDPVEMADTGTVDEQVASASSQEPALPDILEPSAPGVLTEENGRAIIDYSNSADGYVMVQFTGQTQKRLKAQVKGPGTTYTYNIEPGRWAVLPLTDGNGRYQIKVFENITGNQYSLVLAVGHDVLLADEFAPFLRPNQYVNYSASSKTVEKANELAGHIDDPLGKVEAIYTYVVTNLTYDRQRAATVTSGYLPVLDTVLEEGKGICFDYAALMTGMLRSQGIPCKMVFGYAGTAYHAWISVWTEDEGWVDGAIFFDGTTWHRLDPTFASSAGQSDDIMRYIGDGSNYREKYLY